MCVIWAVRQWVCLSTRKLPDSLMNITLLTFNYAATAFVALFCFKKRSFKLLDPAWAFLGGYFINYCVRPTLFLIDHNLGSAYAGLYDDVLILHGVSGSLIFALVGLAGFAIGNLAFKRTA